MGGRVPPPSPERFNLGIAVYRLRHSRRWTAKELAERLDISPTTLTQIERGHRQPSIGLMVRIADVFDIDPHLFPLYAIDEVKLSKSDRRMFRRSLDQLEEILERYGEPDKNGENDR